MNTKPLEDMMNDAMRHWHGASTSPAPPHGEVVPPHGEDVGRWYAAINASHEAEYKRVAAQTKTYDPWLSQGSAPGIVTAGSAYSLHVLANTMCIKLYQLLEAPQADEYLARSYEHLAMAARWAAQLAAACGRMTDDDPDQRNRARVRNSVPPVPPLS